MSKNENTKIEKDVMPETSATSSKNLRPVSFKEIMSIIKRELRKNLGLVLALVVLGLGALVYNYRSLVVAATVNGKPIFRWQVTKILEQQMGEAALNSLVEKQLITDEAKAKNVVASEDEITQRSKTIEDGVVQQGYTFEEWLASNSLTEADFRDQIKNLILVEKLLQDKLTVTDEEIAQFIELYKDTAPFADTEGTTPLTDEEKRSFAAEQIRQQKLQSEYATYVAGLQSARSVNVLVKY